MGKSLCNFMDRAGKEISSRENDSYRYLEYRVFNEKLMKIVDTMIWRKINIICLQKNEVGRRKI